MMRPEYRPRRILGTVLLCALTTGCAFGIAMAIAEGQLTKVSEGLFIVMVLSLPYLLLGGTLAFPFAYIVLRMLSGPVPRRPVAVGVTVAAVLLGIIFADVMIDNILGSTFGTHVFVPLEGYVLAGLVSLLTGLWHWRTR